MVSSSVIPTREQLVARAAELVPLLQKHARWAEDNRRLHDEVVEALADAGVFKLRDQLAGKSVAIVLSGANVDTPTLRKVLNREL